MALVSAEGCRWVVHQGVRILVVSYRHCRTDDEMLQVLTEQVAWVRSESVKVRVLHDYRDAFWGERFVERSKNLSKERREQAFERVAVLGLTGIKKALFQTYRLFTGDQSSRIFETEEAALAWLAS